jgi:hypothetical protein
MIVLACDLADFSDEEVKTYQRMQKGKLITVRQHTRKGDPKQQKTIEEKGSGANDNAIMQSLKTGATVTAGVALAGLSLVGIGAATKAFVVSRHAKQVDDAARRILTAPDIPDLRFLAQNNPSKLPDNFDQYEGIILNTGGWAGENGLHALRLGEDLKKEYPNHLILTVQNFHYDVGFSKDPLNHVKKIVPLTWKNATQGNKTSEELAHLASMVQKRTDKPITFVTASGGGMAVKEAQEITDKLGLKNVKGIGIGSPTWSLAKPKSEYKTLMDDKDAFTSQIPFTNKKQDYIYVDRGTDKYKWNSDPYQGEVPWNEHHEYGAYFGNPKSRSVLDNFIKRTNTHKPEDYSIDPKNNIIRYKKQKSTAYSKLEQQAWANFNILFPSMAEFSGEQEVKVKSYIRNGKLVRAYSAKRDKALENPSIVNRLRSNIAGNIEKKGVDDNTAKKLATAALVVGGTAGTLIGGKLLLSGGLSTALGAGKRAWDSNFLKRNRMIEEMADDLVSGKKLFRGKTLRDAIGDADTVITIKGGINMGGKGGTTIKNEYLDKMRRPGDKWAVLDLDNLELDSTGLTAKGIDLKQTATDFWSNFVINPFAKGYNKDSIEIAAYMRATEKIKPNANKVMMGYSAGAVGTIAAASDLSKSKSVSKLKAVTFGAPYSGLTKIEDTRIVDTVSFINKDDILANSKLSRGNKEDINAIITERPNKATEKDILAGHGYTGYFDRKNWDRIRRIINNGSQEAFK